MKTYIERDFPIERLNPIALGEGNSKKPIYRMHKWWARRLGSVFRMIILTTLGNENESEESTWSKFCNGANLGNKIVLDPFMGGGTTVVEALRLGIKVVGVDLNPVAWFVTKKEVEPVDLDLLINAFRHLEHTAGRRIQEFYQTTCLKGHKADVMYYFWVKTVLCENCGRIIHLFHTYELSRRDHEYVSICPNCLQINETEGYDSQTVCRECRKKYDPRKGISGKGIFYCTECGKEQRILSAVKRKGSPLEMQLHALEGYCSVCGRFFKRADEGDLRLYYQIKEEFNHQKELLLFPRETIPTDGRSDPRPVNHGYKQFWQMFNERQLLSLSILLSEILLIKDQNIRELMMIAFSDCLNTNNMFCKYEVEWHKISLFFSLHAFHPIERPTENNIWGTVFGRGTFTKCFEKVRKAKEYCQRPYERLFNLRGQRYSKYTGNERIEGSLVKEFNEVFKTDHAAFLRCHDSKNLSFIPDTSIDAVITDPPYFDNVQYSELADFFYVWLRIALKETYPWFEPELINQSNEIVKNDKLGKTAEFYNDGLKKVLMECHRVLKDDGTLVFTFHHNKVWAWVGIVSLLIDAGFYVSATPIVRSEGRGEVHSSEGNIKYDCIFICRKAPFPGEDCTWSQLKNMILRDSVYWTKRTLQSGMLINNVDIFTTLMGKTVEHYTKHIKDKEKREILSNINDKFTEMESLLGYIDNESKKVFKIPHSQVVRLKQLSFFLKESKARYKLNTKKT